MKATVRTSSIEKEKRLQTYREHYTQLALKGNAEAARATIETAVSNSIASVEEICLQVLCESQVAIGEMWHRKEISTAEEHLATEITATVLASLKGRLIRKTANGKRAVVAGLTNDLHQIGCRIVGDFLFKDGWEVDVLGGNVPASELLEFIRRRKHDLVAISVSNREVLDDCRQLIEELSALPSKPKVMVGGFLYVHHPELFKNLEPDAFALDAKEAVECARQLCGISESTMTLQEILSQMGTIFQQTRKSKGMSQKELAESSGLDRAYISSVEHGKQNITFGAMVKLCNALELPAEQLFSMLSKSEELSKPDDVV